MVNTHVCPIYKGTSVTEELTIVTEMSKRGKKNSTGHQQQSINCKTSPDTVQS